MAQLAFRFKVPAYGNAALGTYIQAAEELAQKLRRDFPVSDGIAFLDLTTSDSILVTKTDKSVVDITSTNSSLHRVTQAGAAAGSVAVTGALATSVLLAAWSAANATGVQTDRTTEFVANPATAGHFDNTSGTDLSTTHVTFVFYNPPQTEAQVGQAL
jgi:hypothetical protein